MLNLAAISILSTNSPPGGTIIRIVLPEEFPEQLLIGKIFTDIGEKADFSLSSYIYLAYTWTILPSK